MPASEVLDMPLWFRTILTKRYSQNGKRTPSWLLAQKISPLRNSRFPYTQIFFGNLHGIRRVCTYSVGRNKVSNCSDRQQTRHRFFSKQRQFRQHCGMHVIKCCNLISKKNSSPAQSALRLAFSPDWNSKSRRRYVSKSGKICKQHPSK